MQCVYNTLHESKEEVPWHAMAWGPYHPPRCSFVAWQACQDRLPTKEYVHKFDVVLNVTCVLCGIDLENLEHLFFKCRYSREVVHQVMGKMGMALALEELSEWIEVFAQAQHKQSRVYQLRAAAISSCIYMLWETRNRCIFASEEITAETCVFKILRLLYKNWFNRGIGNSRKAKEIGRNLGLL